MRSLRTSQPENYERRDAAACGLLVCCLDCVEPANAIQALEDRLRGLPPEEKTPFAMQLVTRLWGSRRSETNSAWSAFLTAAHLKRLYLLMHQYIRREEDIERAGKGVFSPKLRDDAQEARNRLFNELNKLPGKDAFLAMKEIAELHPDARTRGGSRPYT